MDTAYLDPLVQQPRIDKTPSCRRAINRILEQIKQRYEDGKYDAPMAAESAFRESVDNEPGLSSLASKFALTISRPRSL